MLGGTLAAPPQVTGSRQELFGAAVANPELEQLVARPGKRCHPPGASAASDRAFQGFASTSA